MVNADMLNARSLIVYYRVFLRFFARFCLNYAFQKPR